MSSQIENSLPTGYTLHSGHPSIPEYLYLRSTAGLSTKTPAQAAAIPSGSWYGCYITFDGADGESQLAGMGRVIGDGGWYFHIADMAVHPKHQRKGLGDVILKSMLWKINQESPSDGKPYISLFADEAGRRLYHKNGFEDSAPAELGMVLKSSQA